MTKFNSFGKIPQFHDVIRNINHAANFVEMKDGEAVFESREKPTLVFEGTVKLHGTNAGLTYSPQTGVQPQERRGLVGPELGAHFGFRQWVEGNREFLENMMASFWEEYNLEEGFLTLFGEWAGNGIQKGVAISQLPKAFYAFELKYHREGEESEYLFYNFDNDEERNFFDLHNFDVWELVIDMNKPALQQNKLQELTLQVEECCPVSARRGVKQKVVVPVSWWQRLLNKVGFNYTPELSPLLGEGIVWKTQYKGKRFVFKVKGKKHSTSKVKTLASVDPELVKSVFEFVDYACTPNRILQGIAEVQAVSKSQMPDLLRWVAKDIRDEELYTLQDSGLEWKQVARECNNRVRQVFFDKLEKDALYGSN